VTSFEDIPDEIRRATRNNFETKNNIKTGEFELIAGGKKELWAVWSAEKFNSSHIPTHTLFFAFASKMRSENWRWFCPAKEHIDGFVTFAEVYLQNEIQNDKARDMRLLVKKYIMDTPLSEWI